MTHGGAWVKRRWLFALLISMLAAFGAGGRESDPIEIEGTELSAAWVVGHAVRRPGVARAACRARRVMSRALGARREARPLPAPIGERPPALGDFVPIRC